MSYKTIGIVDKTTYLRVTNYILYFSLPSFLSPSLPPSSLSFSHARTQISSKLIRATFQLGLVCQTIAKTPVERGKEAQLTRDDINCRMVYATNGNCVMLVKLLLRNVCALVNL